MATNEQMRKFAQEAVGKMFDKGRLIVTIVRKQRATADVKDCRVCSGMFGLLLLPYLPSISPSTLIDAIDRHDHYKYVDVELLRLSAHSGPVAGSVIPDQDQEFLAPESGMYDLVIYNNDIELGRVSLPYMTEGSTLSSLAMRIGL